MKKLYTLLAALLIANTVLADIGTIYKNRMQYVLDSVCEKNKIKGISAAILIPGGGIWKGVYGESHAGVPLTTDMYLPIGSNTKTFVASIMLKLQENSQLNLDDTIGTWIQNQPNISGQITIRQLLNHTSGLYNYTNNPAMHAALNSDFNKVWAPTDMFQFVDAPLGPPGSPWSYCNTNYLLAGLIIEQVTGQPLYQVLETMIYTPQKLDETYLYPDEQPNGTIPHGWTASTAPGPQLDLQVTYGYSNIAFLSMATAAGAIMSTAEDNVKFWNSLYTGQIINQASTDEMRGFITLSGTRGYGLGLFRDRMNNRIVFGHGGTCAGYLNENIVDSASGVCITVLSNQDSVGNSLLASRVVAALHKVVLAMPPAAVADINADEIILYPNPAFNVLNINTGQHTGLQLELYDMQGRMVASKILDGRKDQINTSALPVGPYNVRLLKDSQMVLSRQLEIIK